MKKFLSASLFLIALSSLTPNSMAASPMTIARVPLVDFAFTIPCNGETVLINGEVQVIYRNHVDGRERPHLSYRHQIVNAVAVGDLGNIYRLVGNVQEQLPAPWTTVFLPSAGDGPVVLRHNISNMLVPVRNSDGPLWKVDIRANVTVNANGDLIVETYEEGATCM